MLSGSLIVPYSLRIRAQSPSEQSISPLSNHGNLDNAVLDCVTSQLPSLSYFVHFS